MKETPSIDTIIPCVAGTVLIGLVIWWGVFLTMRWHRSKRPGGFSPHGETDLKETSIAWVLSFACILLAGLTLTVVTCAKGGAEILASLWGAFGGILLLGFFMPILWLVTRNRQLEAAIRYGKAQARELEDTRRRLDKAMEELSATQGRSPGSPD